MSNFVNLCEFIIVAIIPQRST